jgi:RNA polymerase sigma factor (sigma-70 family)
MGSAPFWDQSVDRNGNIIRADVRKSAQEVWTKAYNLTGSLLGDSADAAEIMESTVARVSQHLDRRGVALFTQNTNALLFVAFRNQLYSYAAKLSRMKTVGGAIEISEDLPSSWHQQLELHLALVDLVRQLSKESLTILRLRTAGYQWKEIARLLGTTASNVRNSFWRELQQLRSRIGRLPTKPDPRHPSPPDAGD